MGIILTKKEQAREKELLNQLKQFLIEPRQTTEIYKSGKRPPLSAFIEDQISSYKIARVIFDICNNRYHFKNPHMDYRYTICTSKEFGIANFSLDENLTRAEMFSIANSQKIDWVMYYFHEFKHKFQSEKGPMDPYYNMYEDKEEEEKQRRAGRQVSYLWFADPHEVDANRFSRRWQMKIARALQKTKEGREIKIKFNPMSVIQINAREIGSVLKFKARYAMGKVSLNKEAQEGKKEMAKMKQAFDERGVLLTIALPDGTFLDINSKMLENAIFQSVQEGGDLAESLSIALASGQRRYEPTQPVAFDLEPFFLFLEHNKERLSTQEDVHNVIYNLRSRADIELALSVSGIQKLSFTPSQLLQLHQLLKQGTLPDSSDITEWLDIFVDYKNNHCTIPDVHSEKTRKIFELNQSLPKVEISIEELEELERLSKDLGLPGLEDILGNADGFFEEMTSLLQEDIPAMEEKLDEQLSKNNPNTSTSQEDDQNT